ncbi:hypothetical protein BST61_g9409 [Cercospora zeina]
MESNIAPYSDALNGQSVATRLFANEIQRLNQLPTLSSSDPRSIDMALDAFDEGLEVWYEALQSHLMTAQQRKAAITRHYYFDYHTLSLARQTESVLPLLPTNETKISLVIAISKILDELKALYASEEYQSLSPQLQKRLKQRVQEEDSEAMTMLAKAAKEYATTSPVAMEDKYDSPRNC